MRFAINLIFSFLILSLLITVPSFAQQDNDDDFGGEGYGEKALLLEVEVLNLSLFGFFGNIVNLFDYEEKIP